MDLINWSLNAIDTIFSTRSSGSGEPNCPDGTFAAGYTMDAWDRWRVVCLAALSVEDIEDIYLFGTMITGLLLIGLGFALGYRRIQKTGTAVQSLTRLPVMIEAVGRAVSIERMRLLALRLNKHNLIFSGSPLPALALDKAAVGKSTLRRAPQRDALCVPPPFFRHLLITHTHKYTHTDYKLLHIHTNICTHFPKPPIQRLRRFKPPA